MTKSIFEGIPGMGTKRIQKLWQEFNSLEAIKDASKADVQNSLFSKNKEDISAYKKNWQYGSGGLVRIKDSTFSGDTVKFISLDKSKIEIITSKINGKKILEGQNIYIK